MGMKWFYVVNCFGFPSSTMQSNYTYICINICKPVKLFVIHKPVVILYYLELISELENGDIHPGIGDPEPEKSVDNSFGIIFPFVIIAEVVLEAQRNVYFIDKRQH